MAMMRVAAAIWEYVDANGARRRAFFGDVVELTEDEVARGHALGILEDPLAGDEPAEEVPADVIVTALGLGEGGGGGGGGGGQVVTTGGQGDGGDAGQTAPSGDTGDDKPPVKAANHPVWLAYAIKVGAVTEAEGPGMTKAQLQEAVARKVGG